MFPVPKNNPEPTAAVVMLRKRAEFIRQVREFFVARDVLEVDTPLISYTSVTDPYIESIPVQVRDFGEKDYRTFYLQTSPEYAMKRLLAAGSGSIFQICKAFRQGEIGHLHNPEFTMLEWYRVGFTHHMLMGEMDDFLQYTLGMEKAERKSYQALFLDMLDLDPWTVTLSELQNCAAAHQINVADVTLDADAWLQLLFTHCIEPTLGKNKPCFLYHFPPNQAALARMMGDPPYACRFEVYYQGIELANGFYELQEATVQRQRFENDQTKRGRLGLPAMQIDEHFLAALEKGLPDCAGVALGIDRLFMLSLEKSRISETMSFAWSAIAHPMI